MESDELRNSETKNVDCTSDLQRDGDSTSTSWRSSNRFRATAFGRWLVVLGLCMAVFGWWGVETVAGRAVFDEMAGIIPLVTGVAGVTLLAVLFVLRVIAACRQ